MLSWTVCPYAVMNSVSVCFYGQCFPMLSWTVCPYAVMDSVSLCCHGQCVPMLAWTVCPYAFIDSVSLCCYGECVPVLLWTVCPYAFMDRVSLCCYGQCVPMLLWTVCPYAYLSATSWRPFSLNFGCRRWWMVSFVSSLLISPQGESNWIPLKGLCGPLCRLNFFKNRKTSCTEWNHCFPHSSSPKPK